MTAKNQSPSRTRKILKGISRWIGGALFSLALLLLFTNLFLSALVNNTDSLKEVLAQEITDSDIFVDQLLEHSNATEEEINEFCRQNPQEELCKVLEDPGAPVVDSLGLDEFDEKMQPVREVLKQSQIPMAVLLFLGLLFHFLGKISIYDMLYKISRSTFIESALWFILFILSPAFIPILLNQFVPKDTEIPLELINLALNAIDKWFDIALADLKFTMIMIVIISLIASIAFYILKRKNAP